MTEKIEFDLAVKNNNGLEKALQSGIQKVEDLEVKLKNAVAILNKPALSNSFNSALKANTLSVTEFRDGAAASFGIAKKGADNAAVKAAELASTLKGAAVASQTFGASIQSAFSGLLLNPVTATLAAIAALIAALKAAASESANFKRAQLEIETILPKNTKLTAELIDQLEDLSKQYGTTATTQAKAYYQIISAGVEDAADGAKLLARANSLATGGIAETGQTIDLLTTIYNVYGKEVATAAEASDSLFKTVQIGKTTIGELSADLGQALPIAKSFGIGLDEVGAILAQLTNSGISTSESVTLLNAVLSAIAKNGESLGKGFNSTAVQTEGLGVVLERLKERTNSSNDALFELLGRQEAVRAVQSLTAKGLDNYNKTLAEYANKSGVAAEASKKIIEGDVGKQFEILKTNALGAGRAIADSLSPALLGFLKILNAPSLQESTFDRVFNVEGRIAILRTQLSKMSSLYESGKISASSYAKETARISEELSKLSNTLPTASSPLALISTGLEKDAEKIRIQITEISTGLTGLNLGPIESSIKLSELNAQLDQTNIKIRELKSNTASSQVNIAPTVRGKEEIEAEKALQNELAALRTQFAIEQSTFDSQLETAKLDTALTNAEVFTTQQYEIDVKRAEAAYAAELVKNDLILDAQNQKHANDVAAQKREQALITAGNTKVLTDTKAAALARSSFEKQSLQTRLDYISAFGNLASALASDGSKAQFLIQKGAAIAGSIVATQLAAAQALAVPPAPNFALATTAKTLGAINTAAIAATAIKGFEQGGIIGQQQGASTGADNRVAQVRDGEMILNASQQKTLFDAINGGQFSGGNIQVIIDGREVAMAVRNQIQSGFRLA